MTELTFITACPACGAKNRVRLKAGNKVRIRCGRCGEPIAVEHSRMVMTALWQWLNVFCTRTLPLFLLAVLNLAGRFLATLLRPLGKALTQLPWHLRKRLAWSALAALALYYFIAEGTIKFSSLLLLAVLLVVATLVVVVAARGPSALRELRNNLSGRVLRRCPYCGHRYFPLVKNCPNCGH